MKSLTLFLPRFAHRAIEERYGNWQSELLLRRDAREARVTRYERELTAASAAAMIATEHIAVLTDPLLVPSKNLLAALLEAIDGEVEAAVPATNETANAAQRIAPPQLYLTLRQFEEIAARIAAERIPPAVVTWDDADPGIFVARTEALRDVHQPIVRALSGRRVRVVRSAFAHRWASHRGQAREDLLAHIDPGARSILEFGCGEGALGAALKRRQPCRVVGIELDPEAAAIARRHLDEVHSGDVNAIVSRLDARFDAIVGGDVLEHLEDPWTFLQTLRAAATPDTRLLLSIPNVACWPIVADLLRGRFDYVHLGILCAGHLRFFTRQTIEEMLEIAGWKVTTVTPQASFATPERDTFLDHLEKSGLTASTEALDPTGFYVTAQLDLRRITA